MSEWSSFIQAFLSFLTVALILGFIMVLMTLSNEISYAVQGDNVASSEEFRESLNPLYTTGEYLTHKEMALAVYNGDIQPLCARAISIETSPSNSSNMFISSSQFMSYYNMQPNDIDKAANNFASYLSSLQSAYNLDGKMRLFLSPSNIGPVGESGCYYFTDYEGVN